MIKKNIVLLLAGIILFSTSCLASSLPGDSIYQIEAKWTDQDGKQIELKDLRGKPTIFSMVYLTCKYICPTVTSEIKTLESELDKNLKDQIQILLVSFDPERDKPKEMKSYANDHTLDLQRWKMITNQNESRIRELAVATNFKYLKDEKGEFTHSYMILLLDQEGVIKARLDGANLSHQEMINAIKETLKIKLSH